MPAEFSFLEHPIELLLKYAGELLPGIRSVDAVFYDAEKEELRAITRKDNQDGQPFDEVNANGIEVSLDKLRKVKMQYSWLSPADIPFRVDYKQRHIQDVFSEMEKTVLLLRIPNQADEKNDLLFVHYPENMANLGFSARKKELTTEHKEIIAKTLLNSVHTLLKMQSRDRELWSMIRDMHLENRRKMQQKDKALERIQQMYEERLAASCKHYLAEISASEGRRYLLSEGALKLLKNAAVEYHQIENAIKVAVQLANNFSSGDQPEVTEITEDLINLNAGKAMAEETDAMDTVYEKPFSYLSQLEEAAQKAKAKQLPLTAKNLVKQLEKPVAPSAISWAITHYMQKFKHLLKLYPKKWPIITTEFKPVMRIISPDMQHKSQQ